MAAADATTATTTATATTTSLEEEEGEGEEEWEEAVVLVQVMEMEDLVTLESVVLASEQVEEAEAPVSARAAGRVDAEVAPGRVTPTRLRPRARCQLLELRPCLRRHR